MRQELVVRPQELTAFKAMLMQRLAKNFDAIVRANKSPPATKYVEFKRYNLALCRQLLKLDPVMLID